MAPHHCISQVCALCGVSSCLVPSSFPIRLHDSLGWTHDLVAPALTLPIFVLHRSCFTILKQQYEMRTRHVPADPILIGQIYERVRPQPSNHYGQLPITASWTDAYADAKTGRGPAQVHFPDGWRPDIWERTEDPAIEMRACEMDFLLRDPLAEGGSNYRRVRQSVAALIDSILGVNLGIYRRFDDGGFKAVL